MRALKWAIIIFNYVVQGISFSVLAKRRGLERPWLAWIPIANAWLFGKLSDQYRELITGEDPKQRTGLVVKKVLWHVSKFTTIGFLAVSYFGSALLIPFCEMVLGLNSKKIVLPIVIVLGIIFLFMLAVTALLAVIYLVGQYKALFYLFRSCNPETSKLFIVICACCFFTAIPMTICIFLDRNKDLGMPPRPEKISAE